MESLKNNFLRNLRDAGVNVQLQRMQSVINDMKLKEEKLTYLQDKLNAHLLSGFNSTTCQEMQEKIYRKAVYYCDVVSKEDKFIEQLIEMFDLPIQPNSTYVSISAEKKLELIELKMHSSQLMNSFGYFKNLHTSH